MTIPDNTIIAATTDSEEATFYVASGQLATITAVGLVDAEAVSIQILAGTSYVPCYDFDSETLLQVTSVKNPVSIRSPGHYKLVKDATVSAASVHLDK